MGIAQVPAPSGGVTQKVETFNSTTTWTAPANVSSVEVFLVGGGGGASVQRHSLQRTYGGGGGGGIVKRQFLAVTPGQSYTITIGAGGAGATSVNLAGGGSGGDSSFGSLLTARGGGGGYYIRNDGTGAAGSPRGTTAGLPGSTTQIFSIGGGGGGAARISGSAQHKTGGSTPFSTSFSNLANVNDPIALLQTDGTAAGDTGGIGAYPNQTEGGGSFSSPNPGIDGYGCGGNGGMVQTATNVTHMAESFNGQRVVFVSNTTSTAAGTNAIANTGNGGNGGASSINDATYAGGNGASGFCRIVYWS